MSKGLKKVLHICIIITILVVIAFIGLMIVLNYDENGESNMPFEISKITIISTTDAVDVEDDDNIWNEQVAQNNDIYIDITKNEDYSKTQIIEEINLSNFNITRESNLGEIVIYRPSTDELSTFENTEEYETSEITFTGEQETSIQNLQISNQGGRIAFRCANNNVGTYISNDGDELDYTNLLDKIGITNEDLQLNLSFDMEIVLTNGKVFEANINIDLPIEGVVSTGKSSQEITDLDIVFKRIEN